MPLRMISALPLAGLTIVTSPVAPAAAPPPAKAMLLVMLRSGSMLALYALAPSLVSVPPLNTSRPAAVAVEPAVAGATAMVLRVEPPPRA